MNNKEIVKNRIDFVYMIDVCNGNPNGDPNASNLPRVDNEAQTGIITDGCIKRKVRDYIQIAHLGEKGYDMFVRQGAVLNRNIDEAYETEEVVSKTTDKDKREAARDIMCQRYYDVRAFGAVMTTGKNAGQVRGPIQIDFAHSIDPIFPINCAITRVAVATEREAEKQKGENHTIGRKAIVPYGLYLCHGFVVPYFAEQTGFTEQDLDVFFDALKNMFVLDRSAARGLMSAQKLIVFKHDSALGNAPANKLFDLVHVAKKDGVVVPRSFADYEVTIDENPYADHVSIEELI